LSRGGTRTRRRDVTPGWYDAGMKTISAVSALAVAFSVAALGTGGGWAWAALACGLAGTLALFISCESLGYFSSVQREDELAEVVSIEERIRRDHPGGALPSAERHAGARARAR